MAPKRNSLPSPSHSFIVSCDIGYGLVKVVSPGMEPVIFPSVYGHATEIKFQADEIAQKHPGDQITDDDGDWFVGDLALSQLPASQQLKLRGRTADEKELGNVARLRLLKVALGKLFPNQCNGDVLHFQIATGLPVDHMRGAGELKSAILGQHVIHTDNSYFIANITDCMVMPQPYGTIYRNMLLSNGEVNPRHAYIRTGVIDVGTYTVDLALDNDGEYIDSQSGSTESGVWVIQRAVEEAYQRDYDKKPGMKDVEAAIRTGRVYAHGQPVDYFEHVESGRKIMRDATLALIAEKWGTGADVDVIFVSGGGAPMVYQDIRRAYPQTVQVEDSQFANALGYLHYAHFAARGD